MAVGDGIAVGVNVDGGVAVGNAVRTAAGEGVPFAVWFERPSPRLHAVKDTTSSSIAEPILRYNADGVRNNPAMRTASLILRHHVNRQWNDLTMDTARNFKVARRSGRYPIRFHR